MNHQEPKKRVTKNDKKNKKRLYNQKHVRLKEVMLDKRIKLDIINKKNGSV